MLEKEYWKKRVPEHLQNASGPASKATEGTIDDLEQYLRSSQKAFRLQNTIWHNPAAFLRLRTVKAPARCPFCVKRGTCKTLFPCMCPQIVRNRKKAAGNLEFLLSASARPLKKVFFGGASRWRNEGATLHSSFLHRAKDQGRDFSHGLASRLFAGPSPLRYAQC